MPFLLCLPTIPRSSLLLHYGEAWATKLCSLTLSWGIKPAAPPSSSCQVPRAASSERKEGKWLVIFPPFSFSPVRTTDCPRKENRFPAKEPHIWSHVLLLWRSSQQIKHRDGKETLNIQSILQMQMQAALFVVHCTAKHKLLLYFTTYYYIIIINTTTLDSEQDHTSILPVYGFQIN